jgi:hypothetical protein
MRNKLVVTAMVCLMMCFPLALMGQTTQFRFIQDAEFASFSQFTGPSSTFTLQVSRGLTTSSGPTASVLYTAFSETFDPVTGALVSITFTNEFGPIPPTAFTGVNTHNLALNIDTSTLDPTVFLTSSCTLNLTTFVETCGAGPLGVINVQFTENDAQSTVIHALQQEVTNGPITTRSHQRADTSTANVQGSVYGTAVSAAAAMVGVNHLSSIEVIHNP